MKLPNGYGGVSKLGGNRRKPYRARKTKGFDENGKQLFVTIGYFETREQAYEALIQFNKAPYEIDDKTTFDTIYNRWSKDKFETISKSNMTSYRAAYKLCDEFKNKPIKDITLEMLQSAITKSEASHSTKSRAKTIMRKVFEYAVNNNLIPESKNKVESVELGKKDKSTMHYCFNKKEVEKLWSAQADDRAKIILMLIYTGTRPGELFKLKSSDVILEAESFYIREGKNENAKRRVPIHAKIKPFFEYWLNFGNEYVLFQSNGKKFNYENSATNYKKRYFDTILQELGILEYINYDTGEKAKHTPYDTRHTFTTMWHEKDLNEAVRRKIQGHSGNGIGEQVYSHISFEKMLEELNKM